ncbi:hypothetical protein HA402_013082 [Bradysia odoriphaga]|nr:hypothetical protein HA402_013082 [Bradysia odoriphaga]
MLLLIIQGIVCTSCSEKLVIDSDAGADDAASILLALSAWANKDSEFEVVALTCVNGNTNESNVEHNVLKTLTVANVSNIPVYGGAKKPLLENADTDNYFGNDGFGDFQFQEKIIAEVDKSKYAAIALIDLAKLYPGQLNVLCLGPLTNIAIAAALDPSFMENVKRFYIFGGSVSGIGNRSPGVEFNFAGDPESNLLVLNYTRDYTKQKPSLLFPWETVLSAEIPMSWRLKLGLINSKTMRFLNKAESKILKSPSRYWTPADLLATATMIWPQLSTQSVITNVTPVVDGAARGAVLVDYSNESGKPKNAEIVQRFDTKEFQRKLLRHFS